MVDIIEKKRDGGRMSEEEFSFFLKGLVQGGIPPYQASAWCMAVFFRGLDEEETIAMTNTMLASGGSVNLNGLSKPTVDKHSTGGVGDKTSFVLMPILAAAGAAVAKMSGRGLGYTGGTLDKLESIQGVRTDLSLAEFLTQAENIGLVIAGQTGNLVPADKMLYALRDVTGTVQNSSLIASSIMSKKLASGASHLILDVKYGSGALLPDPKDGIRLAKLMLAIGTAAGRKIMTCLSSMEQPLGNAIGNALEVKEAVSTLRGRGPDDLRELCLSLAAAALVLTGLAPDAASGRARAEELIASGDALAKLQEMAIAQGGSGATAEEWILPMARATTVCSARRKGFLAKINTAELGRVAMRLGAGRTTVEESIDPAAGLILLAKLGARIDVGSPLVEIHTNRLAEIERAQEDLMHCFVFSDEPVTPPPLFLARPGESV